MDAILNDTMRQEVNVFLNELRDSGVSHMFGAGAGIQERFDMDIATANNYLLDWMDNDIASNMSILSREDLIKLSSILYHNGCALQILHETANRSTEQIRQEFNQQVTKLIVPYMQKNTDNE